MLKDARKDQDRRLKAANEIRRTVGDALKKRGVRINNLVFFLKAESFQSGFTETFVNGSKTLVFRCRSLRDDEWSVMIVLGESDDAAPADPGYAVELLYHLGARETFGQHGPRDTKGARWECRAHNSEEGRAIAASIDPRLAEALFRPPVPEERQAKLDISALEVRAQRAATSPFFRDLTTKMANSLAPKQPDA